MFGRKKKSIEERYVYCSACGARMGWVIYLDNYDMKTGMRKRHARWTCTVKPDAHSHYLGGDEYKPLDPIVQ